MRWNRAMALVLALLLGGWGARAGAVELKLSTWNLDWLTLRAAGDAELPADVHPKQPADRAMLLRYAADLAADVVAIQEVDGPAAAAPGAKLQVEVRGTRLEAVVETVLQRRRR